MLAEDCVCRRLVGDLLRTKNSKSVRRIEELELPAPPCKLGLGPVPALGAALEVQDEDGGFAQPALLRTLRGPGGGRQS